MNKLTRAEIQADAAAEQADMGGKAARLAQIMGTAPKHAHLYNARGGRFQLIITSGPAISEGVLDVQEFESKKLAKAWARGEGAKPHNY